ncbi:DsbC family protein [Nitrospira calida]
MRERIRLMVVLWSLSGAVIASVQADSAAGELLPAPLEALWPDLAPDAVQPAPLPGWRELVTPDGQVVYLDPSGRYALAGRLVDLWTRRDLSQERLARDRAAQVKTIPEADVLWIRPAGEVRGRLYVFDDPDCPFCRQAHPTLAALAARGVEVGVVLYPVARLHPEAYGKAVAIWCAEDRQAMLDRAMRGEAPAAPAAPCPHPVDRNVRLGRRLGVTGTPYWIAPSGRALAGVRELAELLVLSGAEPPAPVTDVRSGGITH